MGDYDLVALVKRLVEAADYFIDRLETAWLGKAPVRDMEEALEAYKSARKAALEARAPVVEQNEIEHEVGRTASGLPSWLPIESAPKDGTRIDLLYRGSIRLTNSYWHDGRWWHGGPCDDDDGFTTNGPAQPTHWMPLPLPPPEREPEAPSPLPETEGER